MKSHPSREPKARRMGHTAVKISENVPSIPGFLFNPLASICRRRKRLGKILSLVDDLAVEKLHHDDYRKSDCFPLGGTPGSSASITTSCVNVMTSSSTS